MQLFVVLIYGLPEREMTYYAENIFNNSLNSGSN